jgi:hypothetical protein
VFGAAEICGSSMNYSIAVASGSSVQATRLLVFWILGFDTHHRHIVALLLHRTAQRRDDITHAAHLNLGFKAYN